MKDSLLQLALRELKALLASRNLWLTFAAVVLLFAFTGPFGTMERLPFLPRLAYWLALHAVAWGTALLCVVLGDVLLAPLISSIFGRMMVGSIIAAVPIGALTPVIRWAWFGQMPSGTNLLVEMAMALPLCIIFCVISYMAMSPPSNLGHEATPDLQPGPALPPQNSSENAAPTLLARLKPDNRGALQHLSVEDHYTMVKTSRGRELVLLRFSDAMQQAGTSGLQVHRSHWVADEFVTSVNRDNGKLTLRLGDGTEIPVSRTYATVVRARFADR